MAELKRVPVELIVVDRLWPKNTVERVSFRKIYWYKGFAVTRTWLAHALGHIIQRERLGWRYLPLYIWYWILAGGRHDRHRMEDEARGVETSPWYLAWADDLISQKAWELGG